MLGRPALPRFLLSRISSSSRRTLLSVSITDRVATLTMEKPPVNSISSEMAKALTSSIASIEKDAGVQSLVIKSSSSKVFCAGLDITAMHRPPSRANLESFWYDIQQIYLSLYGSRLATVAAIEGHSPAGGCLLAMCCDWRIMNSDPSFKIGLNETQLGIAAPYWLGGLMVNTIGLRETEVALQLGKLYGSDEAKRVGLVDELAVQAEVLTRANAMAATYAKVPATARVASKMTIRQPFIDDLVKKRDQDIKWFCDFVLKEEVQISLTNYLANLGSKKKK